MDYFLYCRDKPGSQRLRQELGEAHWSFMDGYADAMIARGPTLTPDGQVATGSMHIVDLPDDEAARRFAFDEPYYRGGVFGEVMIRRWRNALGRTMWEYEGDSTGSRRFLIIGHGKPGMTATRDGLLEEHRDYLDGYAAHFIARGPLLSDDGATWVGSAMLVEFPDRSAVDAMLESEPYRRGGLYADVEVHHWRFGGRT